MARPPAGRPRWDQKERRPAIPAAAAQRRQGLAALAAGLRAARGDLPHRRRRLLPLQDPLPRPGPQRGRAGGHRGAPRGPEKLELLFCPALRKGEWPGECGPASPERFPTRVLGLP